MEFPYLSPICGAFLPHDSQMTIKPMTKLLFLSTVVFAFSLAAFGQETGAPKTDPAPKQSFSILTAEPLFILSADHKQVEVQRSMLFSDSLQLSPDLIFAIHVRKSEEAIANYGVRGQHGVVLIELKKGSIGKLPAEVRHMFEDGN
jgi:hypothetical protein